VLSVLLNIGFGTIRKKHSKRYDNKCRSFQLLVVLNTIPADKIYGDCRLKQQLIEDLKSIQFQIFKCMRIPED